MYTPLEVAICLSLYQYNVSVNERAIELANNSDSDVPYLHTILARNPGNEATELPQKLARIYVNLALKRYIKEVRKRIAANAEGKS